MKVKVIEHARYGKCRVGEEGWIVGRDVARILGYANADGFVRKHVKVENKRLDFVRALDSFRCVRTALINQAGLDELLAATDNPDAAEIKAWLLSESARLDAIVREEPHSLPQVIEVEGVCGYVDKNGLAWLNVEHVARGLGFVMVRKERVTTSCDNSYSSVRWETVNRYLAEFDFPTVKPGDFIPENAFYLLAMKANNATAKTFQLKVANDILPAIRKDGCYVASEQNNNLLQAQINTLKAENSLLRNQLPALSSLAMAVVYVLLLSNGSVKIGVTDCLPRRIKEIELETNLRVLNFKSTPYLLRNEAENLESFLKDKFSDCVLSGEFFSARFDEVAALIS